VQMTRKKLGLGLLESFSEPCEVCAGRGIIVHHEPILKHRATQQVERGRGRGRGNGQQQAAPAAEPKAHTGTHAITEDVKHALAQIAASTIPHGEHKPAAAEAAGTEAVEAQAVESATAPAAPAPAEAANEPQAGSGRRRGRHRRVTQEQGAAEASAATVTVSAEPAPAELTQPAQPAESAPAAAPIVELPPVAPVERKRPVRIEDAEVLLDSVLDALPAPKKAGEGRSRSRRVSTAALSTAGAPPVITRADGSSSTRDDSAER
jgi:ribonuclease E